MRFLFRADAGRHIGTGHVMRCLALAARLRGRGHAVSFASRGHEGACLEFVRGLGFPCADLGPGLSGIPGVLPHGEWLGVDPAEDAGATLAAIRDQGGVDWVAMDHYSLDLTWCRALRGEGRRILVLDDLADRPLDADILLNQSLLGAGPERYRGLVPASCRLLLGPGHALLREEFYREERRVRTGPPRRILVFFGGTDPLDLALGAARALLDPAFSGLEAELVLGASHPREGEIRALARRRPGMGVHGLHPGMAGAMAKADLALGAAGSTSWERCLLGLPAILAVAADNQRGIAEGLAAAGAALVLREPTGDGIRAALRQVLDRPGLLEDLSRSALAVMAGHGHERDELVGLLEASPS